MFNVGITEILLIAIIALIVLGPKELAKIARVAGRWIGHARKSYFEIQKQLDLDDKLKKDDEKHD